MTKMQFAVLLMTIYIAPHLSKREGLFFGSVCAIAAAVAGVFL